MEILYGVIAAIVAALVIIAIVLLVLRIRNRKENVPIEDDEPEIEAFPFDESEIAEEAAKALVSSVEEAEAANDAIHVSLTGDVIEPPKPIKDIKTVIATPVPKRVRKKRVRVTAPVRSASTEEESKMEKAEMEQRLEAEKIEKSLRRPGVIQIYKDNGGLFRFRVKSSNNEAVGHSQGYTTKISCKNGIRLVSEVVEASQIVDTTKELNYRPCIGQSVFEIYRDNEDKFRFRLRAPNTSNLLASQGYTSKANCKNGIRAVRHLVLNHSLVDSTKD